LPPTVRSKASPAPRRAAPAPAPVEDLASEAATRRLSLYLRALARCESERMAVVSSDQLAAFAGCKSALVRKDLAHFGQFGIRGVGYEVRVLRGRITRILGLERDLHVVIVGAGNLGMALAGYRGFNTGGFRTIGLLDVDRRKIGRRSGGGVIVRGMKDLPGIVRKERVDLAVLAVPTESAQKALDQIAAAGIRAVLNFVPVRLKPRRGIHVRSVDLKVYLEGLAYLLARTASKGRAAAAAG
jgi:redox-sensing transcriptional repressor